MKKIYINHANSTSNYQTSAQYEPNLEVGAREPRREPIPVIYSLFRRKSILWALVLVF